MRMAWIIGIISLWVILTIGSNIARQEVLMSQEDPVTGLTQTETMDTLMKPDVTDYQNPFSVLWSAVTKVWDYIKLTIQIALLYYPEVWQGGAMIIYYILFLPIGIAFVATLVLLVIRGVGSS